MNVLKQAIGLTLLILGLSLLPRAADAVHSWGNYHWEQSNSSTPVALNLGDNVDANWDVHLVLASEDWSVSVVIDTIVVAGSTRPRQCKTQTGNVQVCNDTYGNNGWLGIAGIAVSGDHITAAYVKVNDTYFDTQPYTADPWRQYVMCQEIGHTFGLGHVNENFNNTNTGSCMDYTSDPAGISQGEDNTTPNQHDYTLLAEIYDGHDVSGGGGGGGDGGSGCNPRAPWCNGVSAADVLAGIEANGPRQWGRLISEHGPQEVYEIDLGRGEKIITHVLWTLERANDHEH